MTEGFDLESWAGTWRPDPEIRNAVLDRDCADELAAVLGGELAPDSHALPPMWHLAFFNSWPAAGNVGPDGNPLRGPLLPGLPDRTRMWIGGRWRGAAPLAIGVEATCTSTVSSAVVKHGRSGSVLLATVRHAISQGDVECVVHEQDLAYRSGTATARATPTTPRSPGGSDLLVEVDGRFTFDPVHVFRFSALTRNAHRIHYDADYARTDEGYPGLVVHGPLLLLTMLETPRTASKPPPTSVQYRFDAPVYVGDGCHIAGSGSVGQAMQIRLAARDIDPCATADLRWN